MRCSRLPLWTGYFIYFKFTRLLNSLSIATSLVQLKKQNIGQIYRFLHHKIRKNIVNIGVNVDGSWKTRDLTLRDRIVNVYFDHSGKVLDAIYKTTKCHK